MRLTCFIALSLVLGARLLPALGQNPPSTPKPTPAPAAASSEAEDWKAVRESTKPPLPPSEWNDRKPTDEEFAAFRKKMADSAAASADKARDFIAKYPDSTHLKDAREVRLSMLQAAVQLGVTDRANELAELGGKATPAPSSGNSFEDKLQAAEQAALKLQAQGLPAMLAEFEKGIRAVMKEFPGRPESYALLLQIAESVGGEKALEIAREVSAAKGLPPELSGMAQAIVKKQEMVGQPFDLEFTAVDGRPVKMADLKGKVVLVDFWATWCGPCVAELPKVKAAYQKLNPKGFEIVGISFDQDKEALESFVKKKGMAWPQYFDGEGWKNKFGTQFGIRGIPTMWLVDKQGKLRDLNGRDGLEEKVEKLLAEP